MNSPDEQIEEMERDKAEIIRQIEARRAIGTSSLLTSGEREAADAILRAGSPLVFPLIDAMNRVTHGLRGGRQAG